jgi:orotidine-5'-phosphate decarboxylase
MLPKLCIALDDPCLQHINQLLSRLDPEYCWLKVGSILFTQHGPKIIKDLRRQGFAVFLDLKFHDIPNTVAQAVAAAVKLDVAMLTVHAAGGSKMLQAACTAAENKLSVVAVSCLTSMQAADMQQVGVQGSVAEIVDMRADLAIASGCAGLVCSPHELASLRSKYAEAALVCPGIRLTTSAHQDQVRVSTPEFALSNGADYLVVGRAITAARDPDAVLAELSELCIASATF